MRKNYVRAGIGILSVIAMCSALWGCGRQSPVVVVYTALDRNFSEPIFERFTARTGIRVLPKYDTESTKTVGLVNAIIAEAGRPRCDVFWNNEIVNTIRLKKKGLLQACEPVHASLYPDTFRDRDKTWYGFAARARVIIVNTDQLDDAEMPQRVIDLANPTLKGKAGIAKPLFGTTASHVACLFALLGPERAKEQLSSLKRNDIIVESGNKSCAVAVAEGVNVAGLTDTDDAIDELRSGKPVRIVFPDTGEDDVGTLLIPNTVALIKGCAHLEAGQMLIDYLLSPEVEELLSEGESAQIPLNSEFRGEHPLAPLPAKFMEVDFNAAADAFDEAAVWIRDEFLAP